ncbi:MAG TPA: hypothetical protein VGH54_29405 [Mycobacterium sp.]|uniref:hypothetical protein n=1 Tax=Mycobacterium sp. TaxID=1785 RepID=UPI002F429695
MTFAGVGTSTANFATSKTFTLTPHGTGNVLLLFVWSETSADFATSVSGGNVTWDSSPLVAHTAFTANSGVETVFKGQVTGTAGATVTITTNAGSPTLRIAWQEFSTTSGYASVTLDTSATIDVASGATCPTVNPSHGGGEAYCAFLFDNGTATSGSTSGYTYNIDPANGNPLVYNAACTSASQHPNLGDTGDGCSGIAVLLYEAVTTVSGAASLSGSGTLAGSPMVLVPGADIALSGSGTLSGTPQVAVPGAAALSGTGTLTGTYLVSGGSASLMGSGSLSAARSVTWQESAALAGSGTLGAVETGTQEQSVALTGSGTLGISGEKLGYVIALVGTGILTIPQVVGGLVNGVGGVATPQALPGSSQVAVAPPGSSNWQWLGTLGQVTALTYSFACPGGSDKLTMTIMSPAAYKTQLFGTGWQVKVTRGGHQVWYGKLDQSQASSAGWTLTAVGAGNLGQNYVAFYAPGDVWPAGEPDEIINRAIIRGLPWSNPGLNSSPYASQYWLGQATDPGSQTVTAFLGLICTRGGLVWYVNSQPGGAVYGGNNLSISPLPTVPNRLLVCTTPISRTLGGYYNSLFIRFTQTADNTTTGAPASYNVVLAQDTASVAAHGTLEQYVDLSDVGVMTSAQAQAVGNSILQIYQAASWAGPFTVSHGQLLNMGGQPVDIACDQAGSMVQLVLTDFAYGGSVAPGPIQFTVGAYSYDDFTQTATVTPYTTLDQSLSGLLSAWNTTNVPVTVAST